jgi:hypothetical protein
MIYRNVISGVLHWDFVRLRTYVDKLRLTVYRQSVLGRFISFPVADQQ